MGRMEYVNFLDGRQKVLSCEEAQEEILLLTSECHWMFLKVQDERKKIF